ncbi:DegT/DnrJ/EryC1/StrS family aminotransferase [Wohlfahrtiimonas chitiniclastica]|uniref:DegT/DnrJ/EryC1/StrS family aminotransferase n=1 Tax=Wohlfahrtiimonas chitiniclastica TaxID=400946 RepID=UPI001BCB4641|nr:DegT/DnrJ/EryC1/StrS family aminotransferase [Wohlfahrtiimonas chitiniclastica]MBS7817042.1 DegT/DnrJ/EryC1/StrS family aminotransferase [Wohlfahrtiimonas chitiniclastica]MBS7822754.1 DegT/DnrJ/EryC1/StrS family aminotransferase [Wohlfahrtiimonas chitiniclastica]MBS7830569.1 DegT/DnrJ/EryC1/StrS family aminotransferase [Wohlfahrtiimonas chitiniclastica]MBS7832603.1 DegT/DnrJ/EryC1/StrS family aminotransferase [Wohlfahrtiimonas chitiniclastica]
MTRTFMPFSLPELGEEEIQEVVDSLRSGWITTGPKTKRFEQDFAHYLNSDVQALAINSATAGLHLALEAVGIKAGDEVIVPTYTFTSTAEVVRYLGADPIFVDCDPITLNIDPAKIESAITNKTKAIMPVHFAGLACDMDAIIKIAKKHQLKVIEDAAHAFPSRFNGQLIGTLDTDATVFSFYANKTMTTAEGGMIVSRSSGVIERCKVMRLHGISRDAFDRYSSKTPAWFYEVIEPGFKYNMPDISAAIGIHQLQKIDRFHQKRVEMAKIYDDALQDLPIILPARSENMMEHAWHLYPIRLTEQSPLARDEFIIKMAEHNIGCSVHFIPLHRQPVWRDRYQLKPEMFPNAEKAYLNITSIPLFTKMTSDDQQYVINTIKKLLG